MYNVNNFEVLCKNIKDQKNGVLVYVRDKYFLSTQKLIYYYIGATRRAYLSIKYILVYTDTIRGGVKPFTTAN